MAGATAKTKKKLVALDEAKLKRAQKLLGTETEAETLDRALDEVITERARIKAAWRAHENLLRSGLEIQDVYGVLED